MSDILERLRTALRETYAVERQVGEGGMATVFLAEDLKHHRQVAIKVLRPELAATLGAERFLREIEMAARLQHPHIVPVYDSGAADGLLYYVMPFVEGESLRDLLTRTTRVPLARAAVIVGEAASGLAYAHAQGIVHRDVKPENIMLSGGHAVVTDFGIARAVDASRADGNITGSGMAIGTPAYMSPEQATADKVDARSDQYALACVFYEMVTGKQAFSGPSMQAMLTSMLTGPRPRLAAVMRETPAEVDLATQRALDTDPAKRFPSITAFAEAVAQESTGAAAATRESRRWKRLAIVLPALVAVAAGLWVVFFAKPAAIVVSGAETIAVMPFSTSGAAAAGLGEGMVDLLSSNFEGVGGIHAIEPRTVLREWRRRVKNGDGAREDALAVGRSVKAASVLTGTVVATGNTARLTAELLDMQGKSLAQATLDGPSDSILILADRLALKVLQSIWRSKEPMPSANSSGIVSASMPAIRDYLKGEWFHRRGQWDSAQIAFEGAVAADSTFALAWYRLANTLGWTGNYLSPAAIKASANAVKYSTTLSPRLRTILGAYSLFQQGDPSAADSMRGYLQKFPNDADAWYLLGESQYHANGYIPMAPAKLRAPFDHVLELDSSLTPAAIHPMELALGQRDTAAIRRYAAVFKLAGAKAEIQQVEAAQAIMAGDGSGFARIVQGPVSGSGLARAALNSVIRDTRSTGDSLEKLGKTIASTPANGGLKLQFVGLEAMLSSAVGRPSGAKGIVDSLRTAGEMQTASTLSMTPFYGGFADSTLLQRLDTGLAAAPSNMYVNFIRAMLAFDRGQAARAGTLIQQTLAVARDTMPNWLRGALIGLDGMRMVSQGDTVRGMARADSGLRMVGGLAITGFTTPVQLRYAMLLSTRPATRKQGIERLRYGFELSPELMPITMYYLGKAYEADGQRDEALASYGQFLRLWNHPDSNYVARQREAKEALQRLTAEGGKGRS
ncbi:MAG: protein kinase [Gemmatimonadales bacterium]